MSNVYPFKTESPLLNDVIKFVADCAFPDIDRYAAKKRVRTAIRSEYEGVVRFDSQGEEYLFAEEFFTWAVTKKKWRGGLVRVKGLPLTPNSVTVSGAIPAMTMSGYAIVTPQGRGELEAGYIEAMSKVHCLEQKVAQLKKENTALLAEVNDWRGKDEALKTKLSKAGKANKGVAKNRLN